MTVGALFHKLTAFQRYKGLLHDHRAQVPLGQRAWPDCCSGAVYEVLWVWAWEGSRGWISLPDIKLLIWF